MDKYRFEKIVLLVTTIQLICILVIPQRWLAAVITLVLAGVMYYYYMHHKRFLRRSDQELIRISARLAQDRSEYLSDKSPSMIFIYDDRRKVGWMNQNALELLQKYGQDTWQEYLVRILDWKQDQGEVTLPNDTLHYSLDREKRIVFFTNITEQVVAIQRQIKIQPAIGLITIDNYDDLTDKKDDKEISNLNSFITTFISDWLSEYEIYLRRLNAERYFFVAHAEDIKKMEDTGFSLLDQIRKSGEELSMPLTLSMGIAYGMEPLKRIGEVSQNNIDIALVRGGDQVVLSSSEEGAKPKFYGGKTTSTARRTRVRSRAMSTALKRIFAEVDDIYIMGHRYPDMDAIGSAYGVSCLAEFQNKANYIVIDSQEIIPDVERCLREIHKHPELEKRVISPQEALQKVTPNSLLVMVDYHKPSLSISQDLYDQFDKVAIIDHHRRGEEFPTKPLLTYIESSASSASELVTELIQYESSNQKQLDKMIATLLLSGIFVDTKNFSVRTSARTFDVSSYLKSCGADSSVISYMLSSDLDSFLEISELVGKSDFLTHSIVVATGDDNKIYDSVTTAKTADTLLSMSGIEASFVITRREDGAIGISARSTGKVNVQTIMENLGGGGHFTNAATQITDKSLNEVKSMLYNELEQVIKQTKKENDK